MHAPIRQHICPQQPQIFICALNIVKALCWQMAHELSKTGFELLSWEHFNRTSCRTVVDGKQQQMVAFTHHRFQTTTVMWLLCFSHIVHSTYVARSKFWSLQRMGDWSAELWVGRWAAHGFLTTIEGHSWFAPPPTTSIAIVFLHENTSSIP